MKTSEATTAITGSATLIGAAFLVVYVIARSTTPPTPDTGYCYYESPVVSVGCTDGKCLVCTADHACRWMDWHTTCGQINGRGSK